MSVTAKEIAVNLDKKYHFAIDQKFMDLRWSDKAYFVNKAKDIFMDTLSPFAHSNSKFKRIFGDLVVVEEELKVDSNNDETCRAIKPADFYSADAIFLKVKKKGFVKKILCSPLPEPSFRAAYGDAFWKASFEFEQSFRSEDSNYFFIEHGGKFEVEKVYLSYLKKPYDCHFASFAPGKKYEYADGSIIEKDSGLPFDSFGLIEIIDIAVILSRDTPDQLNIDGIKKNLIVKSKNIS